MGVNREVLLAEMRKSGYYLRPSLPYAYGCYWPEGAPAELPPAGDLRLHMFWDQDGVEFVVAYTADQIPKGVWNVYSPVWCTRPLTPA